VALFAPNSPDALAIRYATHLIGAAAVYLSAPEPARRRAELVAQVDPTLLVIFAETAHLLPDGWRVPVAAIGADVAGASLRLDTLAMAQPDGPLASLARPHDLAVVISSGGTTGVPKGSVRDFAAYTAMVSAPSPESRRQLVNGRLAYLSQALVDITCSAAAASCCGMATTPPTPWRRSRPSGSPTSSWSSRNYSR
jgi:fatty-acyl-CoA synthase